VLLCVLPSALLEGPIGFAHRQRVITPSRLSEFCLSVLLLLLLLLSLSLLCTTIGFIVRVILR